MTPPNLPMGRIPIDAARMRWKDAEGREEKFTDCDFKVWVVADSLISSRITFPSVAEIAGVAGASEGAGLASLERDHWGRVTRVSLNYSLRAPAADGAKGGRA